jgi:oxygen-independent coproporphyrinogen-3 oxidase
MSPHREPNLLKPAQRMPTDLDTLLRHEGSAPRYTSYPPANFFTEDPATIAAGLIEASNAAGTESGSRALSLYFHIPFCPRRCLFCGCHTEVDRSGAFIRAYMETISIEFDLLAQKLDRTRTVTQIHFGGGTPNAVPLSSLGELIAKVRATFPVAADAEIALECDPGLVLRPQLEQLRALGFNRVSFGIQDVNLQVLEAVNRKPARLPLPELVGISRELGFTGINLDLICGLPLQTESTFRESLQTVIEAGPDRISLFPYAHVPWIKGHQTALEALPSPNTVERLRMTLESRDTLQAAGYESIGMDHFARPADELSRAKKNGTLRRNFQGYAPPRAGQIHALGASAISQLESGYLQNEKDLERYMARVRNGELPFTGGYRMRPEDRAARDVINALLCQGEADVPSLLAEYGLEEEWESDYRLGCLERLTPYLADNLVTERDGVVHITDTGFPLSRRIAAAFDPLTAIHAGNATPRYSKTF